MAEMFRLSQVAFYRSALQAFQSSMSACQVIRSLPAGGPAQQLYILDSSFNPPTVAHLKLLVAAVAAERPTVPTRLLLLLATQNADKPPQPAPLEQRLCMMEMLARQVAAHLDPAPAIDLGLTRLPYFVDKASALTAYPPYLAAEQVHLIGFDTLERILDPKYYPPTHSLVALAPFLAAHRLRVSYRDDGSPNVRTTQHAYLSGIAQGALDHLGARREWVTQARIVLDDAHPSSLSSTRVRDAVRHQDWETVRALTPPMIAHWLTCGTGDDSVIY